MVASVPSMKWMIKPRHAISTANQPALEPSDYFIIGQKRGNFFFYIP